MYFRKNFDWPNDYYLNNNKGEKCIGGQWILSYHSSFIEVKTLKYWIVAKNRVNNFCLKWLRLRPIVATKYHLSQKMRFMNMNIFWKIVEWMSALLRCNSLLSALTLTSAHSSHAFCMYAINVGVVEISSC